MDFDRVERGRCGWFNTGSNGPTANRNTGKTAPWSRVKSDVEKRNRAIGFANRRPPPQPPIFKPTFKHVLYRLRIFIKRDKWQK